MKPRICCVGTSHLVALRNAAVRRPLRYPLRFAFNAIPGRSFRAIRADAGGLTVDPVEIGRPWRREAVWWPRSGRVEFGGFDAFLVCGTLRMETALAMAGAHAAGRFSPAYLEAAEAAVIEDDFSFRLAAAIKAATGKPTFFLTTPVRAGRVRIADGKAPTRDDWHAAVARLDEASAEAGLVFRPQPRSTLNPRFGTKRRFAKGTTRLNGAVHAPDDMTHMNAEFGRRVLDDLSPALVAEVGNAGQLGTRSPGAPRLGGRGLLGRLTRSA